jgi:hypothetical protein
MVRGHLLGRPDDRLAVTLVHAALDQLEQMLHVLMALRRAGRDAAGLIAFVERGQCLADHPVPGVGQHRRYPRRHLR